MDAIASAVPSRKPTAVTLAPSTLTRNTGSSAWIISEETSMKRLTIPRAQTPRGIRSAPGAAGFGAGAWIVTIAAERELSLESEERSLMENDDGRQAHFLPQPDVARP